MPRAYVLCTEAFARPTSFSKKMCFYVTPEDANLSVMECRVTADESGESELPVLND